jgi:fluoride exporter
MNVTALFFVALGGALGSVARALASWAIPAGRLPWGTMAVNIAGSLAIGALMARFASAETPSIRAHSFWVIGVCGGFTTFSSFSWQTFADLEKGNVGAAIANVILSVVCCLVATWLGWRLAR